MQLFAEQKKSEFLSLLGAAAIIQCAVMCLLTMWTGLPVSLFCPLALAAGIVPSVILAVRNHSNPQALLRQAAVPLLLYFFAAGCVLILLGMYFTQVLMLDSFGAALLLTALNALFFSCFVQWSSL